MSNLKLHSTCQSNQWYTNFSNLPIEVQKAIQDAQPELLCSSYTVGETMAYIRLDVIIEEIEYDLEVSLGSCDIKHSDFEYSDDEMSYIDESGNIIDDDTYSEQFLLNLMEVIEFEGLDVYLTAI